MYWWLGFKVLNIGKFYRTDRYLIWNYTLVCGYYWNLGNSSILYETKVNTYFKGRSRVRLINFPLYQLFVEKWCKNNKDLKKTMRNPSCKPAERQDYFSCGNSKETLLNKIQVKNSIYSSFDWFSITNSSFSSKQEKF